MSTALANTSELQRPVDGADTDVWGPLEIGIFEAWDRHFGGREDIDVTSGDVTLTTTQAQNGQITVFGTPVADRVLIFPARNRKYFIRNGSGRTLACHVTGFSGNKLYIPNATGMVMIIDDSGGTRAGTRPISSNGSYPDAVTHPLALTGGSTTYSGPGVWFSDFLVGLARRAGGVMGIGLKLGGDTLRFNSANTSAAPMIGFGASDFSAYDSGFYELSRSIAWSRSSTFQGSLGQGIQVGAPTGGELGVGTVNIAGLYYRLGVQLPFQTGASQSTQSVTPGTGNSWAHGLAGAPALGVARLRCVVANNGYAVNEVIANPPEIMIGWDGTNYYYRVASTGVVIRNKATGVVGTFNSSQWTLDYAVYR